MKIACRTAVGLMACAMLCPGALSSTALGRGSLVESAAQPIEARPSGRMSLARLVDLAAELMNMSVTYDSSALERLEATVRVEETLTDVELWAMVNDLLIASGYTSVRPGQDASLSIVRLQDAPRAARLETGDPPKPLPGFVRLLVRPMHAEASAVGLALGPYLSDVGSAVTLDESTLLVSELTSRLDAIRSVLNEIDAPARAPASRVVSLRHLDAELAAGLVRKVRATRESVGERRAKGDLVPMADNRSLLIVAPEGELDEWESLIRSVDHLEAVETRQYSPQHFGLDEVADLLRQALTHEADDSATTWGLIIDRLTGSLLITATASEHEHIRSLLDRLAEAPPTPQRPMRSFVIRNRSATDVRHVLADLLEATVPAESWTIPDPAERDFAAQRSTRTAPRPNAYAAGDSVMKATPSTDTSRAGEGLVMTIDEGTNTLIAIGPPRVLAHIESLLEIIDVRQSQVLLEVLLVSLTEGETRDLGVELTGLITKAGTQIALASLFGLSDVLPTDGSPFLGGGSGGTAVILDPGDFSAVVRALKTINDGRSLSIPRILVNNNESGSFNSVVQEPFASTNASDTVATTSFGGTQDAGTTVSIRPQIAEGDHLVLEYSVSLSSFTGESADPALPPPRQQNNLSSVATIPDGFTIAVGGIELTNEADAVSKVPLLGDVPGFGALFRSRSTSNSRSRFYVFIRATVMRHQDFEDLKYISDQEATSAGIDDGWPTIVPRIIR